MIQQTSDSLSTPQQLPIAVYSSLTVAHLLFGALHPESMVVAASGFAFFTAMVLAHLRLGRQDKVPRLHK